jgi:hypothetical protein
MLVEVEKARAIVAAATKVDRLSSLAAAWKNATITNFETSPNLRQETVAALGIEPAVLLGVIKSDFVKRLEAQVAAAQAALDAERTIPE